MAKKFRLGIIGCGKIAERLHVPDFALCAEAELAAFCDGMGERARALAQRFAPGARVYTDYKAMIAQEKLDGVSVCLPNALHAPVAIHALNAGLHVFVEKPMAATSQECARMNQAAKKNKKLLMVNQTQRRFPVSLKAKEILDSGVLGRILLVTALFGHEGPEFWSPEGKWFFQSKQAKFGAMGDLGIHKVDLVRYLSGLEITEVNAFYARLEKKGEVEDNFVSSVKFDNGALGTITASWTIKGMAANYIIFNCANGSLRVNEIPGRPLVANLKNPACEIDFDLPPPKNEYEGSWGVDVGGGFVRACLGLEEPFCTGEEGQQSFEVILAAKKSAETGRTVKVKQVIKKANKKS